MLGNAVAAQALATSNVRGLASDADGPRPAGSRAAEAPEREQREEFAERERRGRATRP